MRILGTAFIVTVVMAYPAGAATVTIPAGTRIFGELQQLVSSDVKEFAVGDFVTGRVWRNIVVDGQTVITAGAPMTLQVSAIQKRRTFGRAGSVEVRAVSVTSIDGNEIFLDGGYDKRGESRVVLSSTLAALVAWPTLFIKGREAELPPGTIFDAAIPANTNVTVPDEQRPTLRLGNMSSLTAEILYDELTEDSKSLPVRVRLCEQNWPSQFEISEVNDMAIDSIEIEIISDSTDEECLVRHGTIDLKDLSEHFGKGINRFTVAAGSETAEVILDVEM
jgi:hypothetical protein